MSKTEPQTEQLNLYRFHWDCGRMGDVEGLFIATQAEVDAAIGKSIYFGEILGKHSEVYGDLEEGDISLVSDDQDKVAWLQELLGSSLSGYNPLGYIRISCAACGYEICEYGEWYEHQIIDGEYFCDVYDPASGECKHE
jgi:hypothetical protein